LVVASPHSGRHYPDDLLAASRLNIRELRTSEDCFVDELFMAALSLGAPLLRGVYGRAYIDFNREPYELDPAMFEDRLPEFVNSGSPRVAVGLGTIARVVAEGRAIYQRKLRYAEAEQRIRLLYRPYHDALEQLLRRATRQHGCCLLVDAHSMPSAPVAQSRQLIDRPVDIVLGDRMGSSCHHIVIATAEKVLQDLGYRVVRNVPYAGGFTTRHYGVPDEGRHCLQLEVCRALYMDEARMEKLPRFGRIASDIGTVLAALHRIPAHLLQIETLAAAQ
jgi:N-formylglutamate amidohydrolase